MATHHVTVLADCLRRRHPVAHPLRRRQGRRGLAGLGSEERHRLHPGRRDVQRHDGREGRTGCGQDRRRRSCTRPVRSRTALRHGDAGGVADQAGAARAHRCRCATCRGRCDRGAQRAVHGRLRAGDPDARARAGCDRAQDDPPTRRHWPRARARPAGALQLRRHRSERLHPSAGGRVLRCQRRQHRLDRALTGRPGPRLQRARPRDPRGSAFHRGTTRSAAPGQGHGVGAGARHQGAGRHVHDQPSLLRRRE